MKGGRGKGRKGEGGKGRKGEGEKRKGGRERENRGRVEEKRKGRAKGREEEGWKEEGENVNTHYGIPFHTLMDKAYRWFNTTWLGSFKKLARSYRSTKYTHGLQHTQKSAGLDLCRQLLVEDRLLEEGWQMGRKTSGGTA